MCIPNPSSVEIASCIADWYAAQDPSRFQFHTGETVTSIDTEKNTVTTDKGRTTRYDYCVLATGSDAVLPGFASASVEGIFVYRNISDLNKLLDYSQTEGVKGKPVRNFFMACVACVVSAVSVSSPYPALRLIFFRGDTDLVLSTWMAAAVRSCG